jgi:hypothetical protein
MLWLAVAAHAGVMGPTESGTSDAARAGTDVLKATKAAGESQSSKAVDLLIDLQDKRPGVTFQQRPGSAAVSLGTPGAPARAEPLPASARRDDPEAQEKVKLFGSNAAPPVVREPATKPNRSEAAIGAGESSMPRMSGRPTDVPWWMLPSGWLELVRSNREWIIGAVVLLLAAVVGTRVVGRRPQ